MYKISFVILHYETVTDTVKCVDSIIANVDYPDCQIVLVDNGSKNKSGLILKEKYKNDSRIHLLSNQINLGFAKGNNTGFIYAKTTLKADFIIVINNDTLIAQDSFINKIIDRYALKRYDILGPDIISLKSGLHQNPTKDYLNSAPVIKSYLRNYRQRLFLNYLLIDNLVIRIKKFFVPTSKLPDSGNVIINPENIEMEQVKLHGSALVFSPDFVKRYDHAFYHETFLYCEESILHFFVKKDDLVTVYYPAVHILHKEDATSDYLIKLDLMRRRFYLNHGIHSTNILLKLITTPKNELPNL